MKISFLLQRRRRGRNSPAISLFPFLAVLICTMGALVPLLLAIARQARLQALQDANAKAVQHQADAQSQRELAEWRIGELNASRKQSEEQLSQARLALGHVETHARELRQQATQLRASLEDLDKNGSRGDQKQAELEGELEQIQRQIGQAEKQLAAARQDSGNRRRSYAIIPYEGPHGTYRPPIYIECRADAVVLHPEGVALAEPDFDEPLEAGNALDRALRAAREVFLAQKRIKGDGSDEPYPLLLVRPDGIPAYYVARAAMKSWKSEVGYELIGKDWELEFPKADDQVRRAMQGAIADAREERRRQAMLVAALSDPKTRGQYVASLASGPIGGPGAGNGATRGFGGLGGTPGASGLAGGSSLVGIPGTGAGSSLAGVPGGASALGLTGVPGGGVDSGVAGVPGGGNSPGLTGMMGGSGSSSSGVPSGGGSPARAGGTIGPGLSDSVAAASGTTSGFPMAGAAPAGSASGQGGSAASGSPTPGGISPSVASASGATPQAPSAARDPSYNSDGAMAAAVFGDTKPSQRESRYTYRAAPGGGLIRELDPNASGSSSTSTRRTGYSSGARSGEASGDETSARRSGSQRGVVQREEPKPGEWVPQDPKPPERPEDEDKDNPDAKSKRGEKKPKRLADSRGDNWGLPNAARGSVGITRPIRVRCSSNRLELLPDRGEGVGAAIPLGERTENAVDDFVSAVWEHMKTWGIGGRGMYWRPILQIEVTPDAEYRYAELKALLDNSGLIVQRSPKSP